MELILPRYDLPRAVRAVRALLRNPDDLPMVFALIESMSGTAPQRMARKFRRRASGRALLAARSDIVPLLADREALRALPAGSLGRAYLAFVESEGISAEGICEASERGEATTQANETQEYVHRRLRDTHDLWHAAIGYKGDVLGELSILAFFLGQHWNTALATIVVVGLLVGHSLDATETVLDGFRRGRAAEFLATQPWESLLALPLDEVRARLKLGAPAAYTPVRSDELRALGIV